MAYLLLRGTASHLPLRDESVQCCVTSPPYWGLRSYAGEQREVWGGETGCGAWYGALGLEPTPDCGAAGKVRVRRDLTPAQREYVLRRLLGDAAPGDAPGDTRRTASRRSRGRNGGRDAQPTT